MKKKLSIMCRVTIEEESILFARCKLKKALTGIAEIDVDSYFQLDPDPNENGDSILLAEFSDGTTRNGKALWATMYEDHMSIWATDEDGNEAEEMTIYFKDEE